MKRTRLTIFLLIIASIASAVITLCMGAVRIPVQDTLSILLRHLFGTDTGTSVSVAFEQIVWQIRMPRIILGFLAGSGLALCGCVMQAVVQNPMADPYILGVSAGATLGATGSLFLGLGVISGFWAFVGAGGACFLVLALSSADGKTTSVKLILSGMIVNALLTAFSNFIIAVAGDSDGMMSIKFWTMGSLTRAGWKNIGLVTLIVLAAAVFFRTQAQTLDGLMLGEEAASTIGINTFRCRSVYLLMLSVLTGALVSVCGTIGFVGLIIPHVSRAIAGTAHRKLLPIAALSGGLFMLWVDAIARSLIPNTELPVGIFTALVGAPFFSVSIAGKPIVRNLSIEVPNQKFSALLGANGSGKTTLLRSIYRTQKIDSGIVRLDDEDITHFSGKKLARNMAVMGQFNQINFDYTVLDIALMGRYPFHSLLEQERERDYEIALEALDKVGMKSYRDRNFQSLSGGEKQRVVLARALTQSPKILILDEPTNHLDIRYRLEILSIIKDLQITVLAALHDLSLAAQFCDHLYLMKQGEIVTQGQPQAVMTPENLRRIFDVEACVYPSPVNGKLMIQYL